MSNIVFLNGKFQPENQAKISPNDRGFLFADGVYEVIKFYNGNPFMMKEHLDRLKYSLSQLAIKYDRVEELEGICFELLQRNNLSSINSGVYIQITRGVHQRMHAFPQNIAPTIYMFAFEFPTFFDNLKNGIKVITREDIRWLRCDIKTVSLLPNTMLFQNAVEENAKETFLIRSGNITEATHSSVYGIKDGRVVTHPLSNLILPGITRKVLLDICDRKNIHVELRPIKAEEVIEFDELGIAGTGSEITPVVQINDQKVGNGKPGAVTRLIQKEFFSMTYGKQSSDRWWVNW